MSMHELQYPIGDFVMPEELTAEDRLRDIDRVNVAPDNLRTAVAGLNEDQIDTPYRSGGWTIRQVVHHLPDSHVDSYMRLKLALTEDAPLIRTFEEAQWAELPDSKSPIDLSLNLLESLHRRWVYLWNALDEHQWSRELEHPESGAMRVDQLLSLYAWHSDHHIAHITTLRKREGW